MTGPVVVGFVGLVLFHAFRLQAVPKTAIIGMLLQTFAIMLPIITGAFDLAGEAASHTFATNGVLAVAGIYVAFALFPAEEGARQAPEPPAAGDALARSRDAAVATRARFYPAVRSLKATDKDQLRAHLDVAEAGDAEIL